MKTSLVSRIDASLASRSNAPVVVAEDQTVTGAELLDRSLKLSEDLRRHGLLAGDVAGIVVGRDVATVVGILAILRAGGAYLPLDPRSPSRWRRRLLEVARARLLLHRDRGAAHISVLAEEAGAGAATGTQSDPARAYVIGTSGTTGLPKAVPAARESLLHYCDAFAARVGGASLLEGARMATVTSAAADLGNTMIFPALVFSGELHLVAEAVSRDTALLAEYMREQAIDALKIVPTQLRALVDCGTTADQLPRNLLVVGGELFGLDLLERLEQCEPRCAVFNHYGPTETCVGVAMRKVSTAIGTAARLRAKGYASVPIGAPLGSTELHVVDEHLAPLLGSAVGELAIAGPGTCEGYVGQPLETARRFVSATWSGGNRVYLSGDRARRSDSGEVEVVGRLDRQVKIRGHRVEPGAVEAQLRLHPAVSDAFVDTRQVGDLGTCLVAWVQADAGTASASLRDFVASRLPAQAVPLRVLVLHAFPLTSNGKLDPRALPEPILVGHAARPMPATREHAVTLMFAEVLALPPELVHKDFFRLGGNSLGALRLVGRLLDELGLRISLDDFYADPRPVSVALACEPVSDARATAYPPTAASPQSRALWAHAQLRPSDDTYEIPLCLRVVGDTTAGEIRTALWTFAQRHEALRTRFVEAGDGPRAILDAAPTGALRFGAGRLNPATGPLMRVTVTKIARAEHIVDLLLHHIAFDGPSTGVLMRELAELLAGERPAEPQRQVDARPAGERRPTLSKTPGRYALGAGASLAPTATGCHELRCPATLWPAVERVAMRTRSTPFAVVAAAWGLVLSRQDDESEVTIGTPADLRESVQEADLVGYHVNTVLVHVGVNASDPLWRVIAAAQHAIGAALAGRNWPYTELLADQLAVSGTAPTQTMLTVERLGGAMWGEVEVAQIRVRKPRPTLGLDVCVVVDRNETWVELHYRDDVCPPARARCLGDQLLHVLEQIVENPDSQAAAISVLSPQWAGRVRAWSQGRPALPSQPWGADAATARAIEDHSAPAILWQDGQWTRGELEAAVEQASQALVDAGAGPGHAVEVRLPPSPALVVAWHAAHRVGAAVLPLDPSCDDELCRSARELAQISIRLGSPDGLGIVTDGVASSIAPHPPELAYIVLTSGSTGRQKAVAIHRSALANQQSWFASEFPIDARDRVLAHTAPGFDVSVWEMLAPLASGAAIVLPALLRGQDPSHLAELIERHDVTILQTVPSLLDALLAEQQFGRSRVRLLLCGGEELPVSLAARVRACRPEMRLVNMYGPTETTIDATFHRVEARRPVGHRVPIGRPIGGATAYVVDEKLDLLPPGAFGQLAVGGLPVGLGYLAQPDATARSFVPDPFALKPAGRLYLTGDRARWTLDGELEFGGRRDNQVKVRGNRVALDEVERALESLPEIHDAVVHLVGAGTTDARLVALLQGAGEGVMSTIDELHARLAQMLPTHMIPSGFRFVESLPRLANGKLARNVSPHDAIEAPSTQVRWRTALEGRVADAWAAVVGNVTLEPDLPFYASGGTSLLVLRLRAKLLEEFGQTLSVPEFFEHTTIRMQAAVLDKRLSGGNPAAPVAGRGLTRSRARAGRRRDGA